MGRGYRAGVGMMCVPPAQPQAAAAVYMYLVLYMYDNPRPHFHRYIEELETTCTVSLAMILKRYLIVCWKEDLSSYLACIWIV